MAQYWGRIDGYLRGRDGNSHIGDWDGNRTFDRDVASADRLPGCVRRRAGVQAAQGATRRHGDLRRRRHVERTLARVPQLVRRSSQLPVVWVVNNNLYAYSTPNELEFPVPTIAQRADAYGMPGRAGRRRGRAGGGRGARARRWSGRASGGGPVADRVGVAPVERPRGARPREVRAEGAARGLHDEQGPGEALRGFGCSRASSTEQDVAEIQGGSRRSSRRATSSRRRRRSPSRRRHKGLWVEDGYWRASPAAAAGRRPLTDGDARSRPAPPVTAPSREASAPRTARPRTSSRSPRRSGRRWSATSACSCSARTSGSTVGRSR